MAERVPFASELSRIMERVACEVTRHVGQLELRPVLDENFPAETGGCQVQTTLYGGYHSRITLTSNYLFFFNLAKNMMEESPTLEDVADYAVEYFNVLCGHIVAEIFRVTGVTANFVALFLDIRFVQRLFPSKHVPNSAVRMVGWSSDTHLCL